MEWITDRRPELKEATNEGDVWVYDVEADEYLIRNYEEVKEGQPWMEIPPPPSYVKMSCDDGVCDYCFRKESNCECSLQYIDADFGAK